MSSLLNLGRHPSRTAISQQNFSSLKRNCFVAYPWIKRQRLCHWRRWCLVQIPDSRDHDCETVLRLLHSKMNRSWTDLQMNRELKPHYVSSLRLVYSILLLIPEIETATKISVERWKKIHKRFSWLRATIQWANEKKNNLSLTRDLLRFVRHVSGIGRIRISATLDVTRLMFALDSRLLRSKQASDKIT